MAGVLHLPSPPSLLPSLVNRTHMNSRKISNGSISAPRQGRPLHAQGVAPANPLCPRVLLPPGCGSRVEGYGEDGEFSVSCSFSRLFSALCEWLSFPLLKFTLTLALRRVEPCRK